ERFTLNWADVDFVEKKIIQEFLRFMTKLSCVQIPDVVDEETKESKEEEDVKDIENPKEGEIIDPLILDLEKEKVDIKVFLNLAYNITIWKDMSKKVLDYHISKPYEFIH